MRIAEVLSLTLGDIQDSLRAFRIQKLEEWKRRFYVSRKILVRLSEYVKANNLDTGERIFPISYVAAWSMLKKAVNLVNIELWPHELRRHAATYASKSGTPLEIVSKIILCHVDLSLTQRYFGKGNDAQVIRWIETLYG